MTVSASESAVPKEQFPSWEFFSVSTQTGLSLDPAPEQVFSFFWARNAIYHSLKALGVSPHAHVLLPAYLCRAAVEPFEFYGANVEFYSMDRSCQPDFSELEAKITRRTEVVLAVHYFGFPQQVDKFRSLCDAHRIALIEDCAHVLQGTWNGRRLGAYGDASVFSWRKFLPIYDGGELWLNKPVSASPPIWQRESPAFTLKVSKSLLDKSLENSSGFVARCLSWTIESLKSAIKRLKNRTTDTPLFELDSNRATFDPSLVNQQMSRVSRWLRKHSNVTAVLEKRRQNYQVLLKSLRGLPHVTLLHEDLPDSVCPWIFPIFFDNIPDAHLLLQREGVPAVNWSGVRPPGVDSKLFPVADFLYDNLIFLPVHQNISANGLDSIVRAVQNVAAAGAAQPNQPELCRSSKIA